MAQPVEYTYSGAFIPGTLARAEAEASEFTSVQVGFQALAYQGVDSGAANAYVVTTSGGQCGAYSDGLVVEFKAANSNTGGCTIAVDSGAVVGLTLPNGQTLLNSAIVAGNWYRCMYNSTYSSFTVIAPTAATVITSNTISTAAPTHLVGLASAGGISTACIPIDITFAIDQSIAPTWTGTHTFSSVVNFNAAVNFATGLTLTGAQNAYALTADGSSVTGKSFGLEVNAGTNASDIAFLINNQAGSTQFFEVNGQGSVTVGTPTGGAQGVGTINATGLFVNGAAVKTTSVSSANPSATIGLAAVNGTAATFMTSDSAPALSQAIVPTWTGAHTFTPSSATTAVEIHAAVNNNGLRIDGGTNTSNVFLVEFLTGQGAGFSSGLLVQAGTSSADNALLVRSASAAINFLVIGGDGHGTLGPSGTTGLAWSTTGATTVNASAANALTVQLSASSIFVVSNKSAPTIQGWGPVAAALVDMTPDKSSFTGTLTGMTSATTGTVNWTRQGHTVTMYVAANITGTSNSTAMTMTGMPAALRPANAQDVPCVNLVNNSNPLYGDASVGTNGTITFSLATVVGAVVEQGVFTNTGTKGLNAGWTITYTIG